MTDPIGSQGVSLQVRGDADVAFEGGSSFMERLTQLAAAKDAAVKAQKELALSKSIVAAQNEAKVNLAQSKTIRASAEADAKAAAEEAAKVRAKAKGDADKLVADAKAEAKRLADEATAAREKAKDDAARMAAAALMDRDIAAAKADTAHKRLQAADELGHRHAIAKEAADKAHEDAKAVQARYEAKLARIEAFAAELRGNGS